MIDPWELILHHSYAGAPGVVFDQSSARKAHGSTRNIAVTDFRPDGQSPGSGAVRFNGSGTILVDPGSAWDTLNALRIQMVVSKEALRQPGTLIDSSSFTLEVDPNVVFRVRLTHLAGTATATSSSSIATAPFPDWVLVSLDAFAAGLSWSLADVEIGVANDPSNFRPLRPFRQIAIGGRLNGTNGIHGLVDDVKIWRTNPLLVDTTFLGRPDHPSDCWADWGRKLLTVFTAEDECGAVLRDLLLRALAGVAGSMPSDVAASAQQYQQHWAAGEVDQIAPIIIAMTQALTAGGHDPAQNPDVQRLLTHPCFARLVEALPPPNCDPQFTGIFDTIARGV